MKWPWSVTAKGFAMGMADLVPGVSGGTIALIAGIYDTLLNSLSALSGAGLQHMRRGELKLAWQATNGTFLLALVLGMGLAIATLASPLHWLMEHHPTLLRAFFFGLVFSSIPMVGKHVPNWRLDSWVWAAVGCAVAGFITSLPPLVQADNNLFFVAAGALAICAMLLPGISGSFLLLILGAYAPILAAIKNFEWLRLIAFGSGVALGLVAFSRGLTWLLRTRRRPTMAVLTGFLLGSLQALWPWKIQDRPLYIHSDGRVEFLMVNTTPGDDGLVVVALAMLGGAVVWGLHLLAQQRD